MGLNKAAKDTYSGADFPAGPQKLNSAGTFTDHPAKEKKTKGQNLSGGKVRFTTLPVERFGRNYGEDIYVVDDMKIKRLIAEQIGPKASAAPGTQGAASSPEAAPPPSPSPSAPQDGGGIPCVA